MNLPNVLIIGAMKAGTTSLYMDLTEHPQVYRAQDKEPHALCDVGVLRGQKVIDYDNLYVGSSPGQLIVDASTGYAKRPDCEGIAGRAVQVLPADFKVLYMVRDPIERIISQHYHEFTWGWVSNSIDQEVRRHPRFVDYSRYFYQLQPWLKAVGRNRIHVVCFEEYVKNRAQVLSEVFDFLGLESYQVPETEGKIYNKSDDKAVKNRFWNSVQQNPLYRHYIRKLLSPRLRISLQQLFLPKAPKRPTKPHPETIEWLQEQLRSDLEDFYRFLGYPEPLWKDVPGALIRPITPQSTM